MITYVSKLDMRPGSVAPVLHVSQYDSDFQINFDLWASSGDFVIESGTTATVRGTKLDGNGYSAECVLDGKRVTVAGHIQMTAIAGQQVFEITLHKGDKELNSANFILDVERAAMDKDTFTSDSDILEAYAIVDRTDEIIAAANLAAQSVAQIQQDAEDARNAAQSTAEDREHVDEKAEEIMQVTTYADQLAQQALSKATNAENESAETANALDAMDRKVQNVILSSEGYVNDGYVENGVAYFVHDGNVLFEITGIGGGGGGGGDHNNAKLTVTNTTGWLSKTIADGGSCPVSLNWSSIEDEMPTGDGTLRITVNGAVKGSKQIQQGNISEELSGYLSVGSNVVKVQVSDIYGNARTINFSITVIALSISSTFDPTTPYTGPFSFTYTPVGAVLKTVHFVLDGQEIGTQQTSVSGRQMSYAIPAQSHGAHKLRAYFTAEINGETVQSNTLSYEFIALEQGSDTVIITSAFDDPIVDQYTTIHVPYQVYNPNALSSDVVITVNGERKASVTVDRTEQVFSYRADTEGQLVIWIISGGTTKEILTQVRELDIDVEAETQDLSLYLTAQGRSNQEEHPEVWTYQSIAATLSDFNFTSDGWVQDADGSTVLRVSGDARVAIPYQPFASDFRSSGKTIEIEFATRNVLNYDATVISCWSNERGFKVTAQNAILKSEQSEISTQYKEDEHVRIAFVVEKRSKERLIVIYINGIASGVVQYPENDDFSQTIPVNISIGSNGCTTDIYCIRIYDNDLTRYQILDNWIADSQVGADLVDRYKRNDVYDAYSNIVISKLPSGLPYMIITCPELPQYKGDKKTVSGSYEDPMYPSKSFTFEGAQADVQGTSSQYYPRKNYKIKFKEGFVMKSGARAAKYAINPQAVPVNTFTFKADVASSEGANNVELVRLYNEACPYKTPGQIENPKVRQGIDGFPIVIFWNDGENTTFLGKYNFNNDKGTEEVFGFVEGDESWEILNNTSNRVLWKSDDYAGTAWQSDFEARYPDTKPAYTNSAQLKEFASWLKSTDRTQATGDALPEPVTYTVQVKEQVEHVDPDTGAVWYEEVIVTRDVTFENDTAEYRLAKFKDEAQNYMELDSAIFYYLFTELFLMVDSRAKNAFPSFMGQEVIGDGD